MAKHRGNGIPGKFPLLEAGRDATDSFTQR
jgi:hypothetical protein